MPPRGIWSLAEEVARQRYEAASASEKGGVSRRGGRPLWIELLHRLRERGADGNERDAERVQQAQVRQEGVAEESEKLDSDRFLMERGASETEQYRRICFNGLLQ